ncbi:MAG TPA: squalene synthase HpnC [Rhizomicrobium sp.]|nr:squalene synthase HpnC [Rhizomicrobium sp.]
MTATARDLSSGKGHTDENFPVASMLIARKHRPAIMAFYAFARAADDVADNTGVAADTKLALLEDMKQTLLSHSDSSVEALSLRKTLADHALTNQHALDLLEAFRRDVTKLRYANWADLMDYCRYSAMPVGRFVLDVHGESRNLWPMNDALCAALQIVNHLQDCGKDYAGLNRVYIPADFMHEAGIDEASLAKPKASLSLQSVIIGLAHRTQGLLEVSRPFAGAIRDRRLALEVSVIQTLAEDLTRRLTMRDPLSERVHHTRGEMPGLMMKALAGFTVARFRSARPAPNEASR